MESRLVEMQIKVFEEERHLRDKNLEDPPVQVFVRRKFRLLGMR